VGTERGDANSFVRKDELGVTKIYMLICQLWSFIKVHGLIISDMYYLDQNFPLICNFGVKYFYFVLIGMKYIIFGPK
jgi:hypothetical protein